MRRVGAPGRGSGAGARPNVGGLVRPRLVQALETITDARIGVVTAPAGSGKTALLAQWAAGTSLATIWCGRVGPAPDSPLLARIAHGIAAETGSEPQTYDELIGATNDFVHPVVFVVDDFDRTGSPAVELDLERFLLDSSPRVRLLVSSRRRLRCNLARSELPAAVLLSGEDLRFRTYEIEQLFRETYRQPLTTAGIQNLAMRTDGWAACLHLFHLAFSGRHPVDRNRAAESLGDHLDFAADYLDDQVLSGLPQELRDFLEATSLFDVLSPGLCDVALRTRTSRHLLRRLEDAGLLERDGGDETYRLPRALGRHLRFSLFNDGTHADWPDHCASAAEASGHVTAALRIRAEAGDWDGLLRALSRAGADSIRQGQCNWSALVPDDVRAEPLTRLAEARRLLDDGALTASAAIAGDVRDHPGAANLRRLAAGIGDWALGWAGDTNLASSDAFAALRAATRRAPASVARSLHHRSETEAVLASGLAHLLAGDQRAAIPLLRRCAANLEQSSFVALSAQLALIVVASTEGTGAAVRTADELDGVRRAAELRGYTWLARLAAGLSGVNHGATSRTQAEQAAASCDDRGDPWGAALVLAGNAIRGLLSGHLDAPGLDALSNRFRALGAAVPEAWSRAGHALAVAVTQEPDAVETAHAAVCFARMAEAPGALALAYAAWAMSDGDRHRELLILASDTAREGGLLCRPWTRFAAGSSVQGGSPSGRASSPAAPNPEIEVRCFGGFSLRRDGKEIDLSKIRPQARTVLRILAIHRGQPVHRDVLIDALWGNLGGRAAMHMLQVSVSALRGVLAAEGQDGPALVSRDGEAYALALEPDTNVDLLEFDDALHTAALARTTGDVAAELAALREAAALFVGDLLPEDGPSEWVVDARDGYRLRAAEAVCSLARLEFEQGNHAAAEAAAIRSIEIDPYRDASWRTLIRMYQHSGDVVAARRAQQRYRSVQATLGVTDADSYSESYPVLFRPLPSTPPQRSPLGRTPEGSR